METILSVKNLSVCLKSNNRLILNNVSFDLNEGDVMALDGKNGSGKSTLMKIIFGSTSDYKILNGEVFFYPFSNKNILNISDNDLLSLRQKIGFVKQKDDYEGLNKLTISDLIIEACKSNGYDCNKAFKDFEQILLSKFKVHFTLKDSPAKLSGGEQRLISIFIGLLCKKDASLFVIDEPLNNLDFENVMAISDLINEVRIANKRSAMLMVTHCKIITCINRQRKIIDGEIQETDSKYECHHCMGEPDCNLFYLK